jgi:hypothetical protein
MSDLPGDGGYSVLAPSGADFQVLTPEEVAYFEERAQRYTTDNHFVNVSDFQDVDRMLIMELMCYRWGLWLSQERDYWGNAVDLDALKKALFEYSKELRLLKKSLGIDKAARDKERGENVSDYLETLKQRAKEFGVMREQQLTKCITLFQELSALVTLHKNTDEVERRENNVELHDIFEWIDSIAIPEFESIDRHFRENSQKFWIRKL